MSLLLAADLSITCPGLAVVEIETLKLIDSAAIIEKDEAKRGILYARAYDIVNRVLGNLNAPHFFSAIAMEGPAIKTKYRNEETTAVRQAFYDIASDAYSMAAPIIVVNPKEAKRALTGNGNADKTAMLNCAIARTRRDGKTSIYLERFIDHGRIGQPQAWAVADAYGVACAAVKIHFQRSVRERYLAAEGKSSR